MYGSLIIYDQREPDDPNQSCIKSLTPETERSIGRYTSPYPLNDRYFFCVWSPDSPSLSLNTWVWYRPPTPHGIYLIDAFGNKTLLYRDPEISCMGPLPVAPREKEPAQPHALATALPPGTSPDPSLDPGKGVYACVNVYESELPWPEERPIRALRIVQIFPKTTPKKGIPPIAYNVEVNARGVIGEVPVEADGSAHFVIPSKVPVYFQALDENGLAVQSMRSSSYAMPGERLTCLGCHERKSEAPQNLPVALALKRPPSVPVPGPEGSWPLTFPRLVQPVLDAKCVACHRENKDEKAPELSSERGGLWNCRSKAYASLGKFAWCYDGDGSGYANRERKICSPYISVPGKVGATEAPLYHMLTTGSHRDRVELSAEELKRITLWLDCMSCFFGAYNGQEEQRDGALVIPDLQ
jgi:hypothetical protein